MPPLRVLHVTPYSAEAWAYGGIPRLAGTLTRELARLGHEITVCATDACTADRRLAAPQRSRAMDSASQGHGQGVTVRIFPNLSNRLAFHAQLFLPLGLRDFLRRHASRFDVAHLHACRNAPGAIAAQVLTRAGVPYVLAPNGTAPVLERRYLAKYVFDLCVGRRVTRGAARVLSVSRAETKQLEKCGVDASRVCEIPNPVDLEEFRVAPPPGVFRSLLGLHRQPLVVFLGKITPRKRVDLVVQALAVLPRRDVHLAIAGSDMGGLRGALGAARALNVEARVHTVGLLTGQDRLAALADADVVVYASEHEVFGLVPLEALLAGTPVVVADDSGCGDIIESLGGQRVVPAGDLRALASAIGAILNAPEPYRTDARSAAAEIRRRYDGALIARRLSDLYAEVTRERRIA
jgi:glycosyltransferase involved in cell wall biosynthesis